jgi:hypothetical protein
VTRENFGSSGIRISRSKHWTKFWLHKWQSHDALGGLAVGHGEWSHRQNSREELAEAKPLTQRSGFRGTGSQS